MGEVLVVVGFVVCACGMVVSFCSCVAALLEIAYLNPTALVVVPDETLGCHDCANS